MSERKIRRKREKRGAAEGGWREKGDGLMLPLVSLEHQQNILVAIKAGNNNPISTRIIEDIMKD